MPMGLKELVAEARQTIDISTPEETHAAARDGRALVLDVREPAELDEAGRIEGAVHVPRGLLEAKADPTSPLAEKRLTAAQEAGPVHVLCASGGRAALAAATLRRMGYDAAVIEGGFAGWTKAGLPVAR